MPANQQPIYLDHLAATPVLPEVFDAMRPYFTEQFGSPSSLHRHGLAAREALERAREQVARFINAEAPEDILFTSGGTEALNLAVKGTAYAGARRGSHLVASAIEHPAVLGSMEFLHAHGFTSARVPVDGEGLVNPADVAAALTDQTLLLCVQHANHDLGAIQPLRAIADFAAGKGIPLLVDASASGGWLPLDVQALGADLVVLAPHRFYGPKGVGVLYKNRRTRLRGVLHGGVQEGGRRAGTENIPAIVGAGMAAEIAGREWPHRVAHTARLQQMLWAGLRTGIPCMKLNGPDPGPNRLSTNLNLSFEFIEGEGVALAADLQGMAMASGAACVTQAMKVPPVLAALGIPPELAKGNVILTLGKDNTAAEMAQVLEKLPQIVGKLRGMSPLWDAYQHGQVGSSLVGAVGPIVKTQ